MELWLWKNISDLVKGTRDLGLRAVLKARVFKEKKNKQRSLPCLTVG